MDYHHGCKHAQAEHSVVLSRLTGNSRCGGGVDFGAAPADLRVVARARAVVLIPRSSWHRGPWPAPLGVRTRQGTTWVAVPCFAREGAKYNWNTARARIDTGVALHELVAAQPKCLHTPWPLPSSPGRPYTHTHMWGKPFVSDVTTSALISTTSTADTS